MTQVSSRMSAIMARMAAFTDFFAHSEWTQRINDADINDFVVGNPQAHPLPEFTQALQEHIEPRNKAWFAYKENEAESRAVVAAELRAQHGSLFEADDVFMTNGGFAGLTVALTTVVDPGDEVIFISPPWFFYEALIVAAGGVPVRVKCHPTTFDLDLNAIEDAMTERTRAIIINSPNNPTGKVYPPLTLQALAKLVTGWSERNGRPIYLLSDEAYSKIIYDGRSFVSPATFYPHSFLIYTYGKTLLTPGQRMGYIALPPTMPNREPLREALFAAQIVTGWAFPNALLQHALADLALLSIDVSQLQRRRDRMVSALQSMGYELRAPDGTFYLLVRSPLPDDRAFIKLLAEYDVFVLPGSTFEMPGYFRVSLTANDVMVDRALPGFAAAILRAEAMRPPRRESHWLGKKLG